MLRSLDKAGKITLPVSRKKKKECKERIIKPIFHDNSQIPCSLRELIPLQIKAVTSGKDLDEFKFMLNQYHYLSFNRTVGENMKYTVYSADGRLLACLLFGSAAWKCKSRDEYLNWDRTQRETALQYITNNTRFLILPWVKVSHLASHILSKVTKRISNDCLLKYGHPIYCLETFVECERFSGTCYKAANWICVGTTTGRGRNDTRHISTLPHKNIYLYPLIQNFKKQLKEISNPEGSIKNVR